MGSLETAQQYWEEVDANIAEKAERGRINNFAKLKAEADLKRHIREKERHTKTTHTMKRPITPQKPLSPEKRVLASIQTFSVLGAIATPSGTVILSSQGDNIVDTKIKRQNYY